MYLPFDFTRDANLGYAFVNLETNDAVDSWLWAEISALLLTVGYTS